MAEMSETEAVRVVYEHIKHLEAEIDRLHVLNAELVASRAEPPRPAAIVVCGIHDTHGFEDADEARQWVREYGRTETPMSLWKTKSWTWHPKA